MSTIEADIATALDSDDTTRLEVVVSCVDWSREQTTVANRILQRVALYGCSARSDRYRHIVQQMLAAGVQPTLSTCALLQTNDLAERIVADHPSAILETDENEANPLHHAAERGNAVLVARLCALGAPLEAVDARGETPLAKALHAGPWKTEPAIAVVALLREHGARVDALTLAALGDADALAEALDGVSANISDERGRTALFIAARNNHVEAVRVLLAGGADPTVATHDGQTPLSTACLHALSGECDVEIVRALVRHGAEMTVEAAIVLEDLDALREYVASDSTLLDGQDHESALGYAIHAWHPAALRCLIQSGARPNVGNWQHIDRIAGADTALVDELRRLANPPELQG